VARDLAPAARRRSSEVQRPAPGPAGWDASPRVCDPFVSLLSRLAS